MRRVLIVIATLALTASADAREGRRSPARRVVNVSVSAAGVGLATATGIVWLDATRAYNAHRDALTERESKAIYNQFVYPRRRTVIGLGTATAAVGLTSVALLVDIDRLGRRRPAPTPAPEPTVESTPEAQIAPPEPEPTPEPDAEVEATEDLEPPPADGPSESQLVTSMVACYLERPDTEDCLAAIDGSAGATVSWTGSVASPFELRTIDGRSGTTLFVETTLERPVGLSDRARPAGEPVRWPFELVLPPDVSSIGDVERIGLSLSPAPQVVRGAFGGLIPGASCPDGFDPCRSPVLRLESHGPEEEAP
ncbi:MAG: hypothetical protein H6737_23325 [Alphaproteobacteria bacterium]|nr:hypothetical protein [Alphaproteobacteria bacterium]